MDVSALRSLSDDDLRERLEENGYNPPPITDGAVREIMRRKLFKFLNPNEEYPEEDEACDVESDGTNDEDVVEIRERKHFGAGDTPSTSESRLSHGSNSETNQRSSFPVFVAVCFVVMNISLAICIFYRDWLF
nr:Lamino associated polypeptide [Hymenolepis microstoma]